MLKSLEKSERNLLKLLLLERWEEPVRKYFVPYVCFTTHWRNVRRTLQVNIARDSDNLQCADNTDCRWPNYHYKHLLAPDSSPDAGGCHLLLNHVPKERLWSSYPGIYGIRVSKQLLYLMEEFSAVRINGIVDVCRYSDQVPLLPHKTNKTDLTALCC